jgi:hypothetical protein
MKKLMVGIVATAVVAAPTVLLVAPADAAGARTYKNCTALNKVHPHGVGLPKAKDRTSGVPVVTFKRNRALYVANKKSDRDGDGIACEKR